MIQDYFKIAFGSLRKRKLRSWLTIFGIVIAIATIFVLISLSIGLQTAVTEQFRLLGTDKFFIQPLGQAGGPGSGGAVELTTEDVKVVEKVSGVKDISYNTFGNGQLIFGTQIRYFFVIGAPLDRLDVYDEIQGSKSVEGKELAKGDSGIVILGNDFLNASIFKKPIHAGDTVYINGKQFEVKGIRGRVGNPGDDRIILMPMEDFKKMFNSGERVDQILVQVDAGENITEVAYKVERKLLKFRNEDEKTKDFDVSTPEELLGSFQIVLNVITAFLFGVAAISLLVGGIGIMNTMYTSVLERTREIGTMKAVGARNSDIYEVFIIESGLIGLIGGTIGVLIGVGASKLISIFATKALGTSLFQAATPLYLILGCLLFAFLIGALAGSLPSWQASRLSPVEALRYE